MLTPALRASNPEPCFHMLCGLNSLVPSIRNCSRSWHPDIRTIIGHRERTFSGCKGGQHDSTRTDFHQRAITVAHYPHVYSIKQNSGSSITNRERAEVETIGRSQLGNSLVEIVCDPNILSLGASCWIELRNGVTQQCRCVVTEGNPKPPLLAGRLFRCRTNISIH